MSIEWRAVNEGHIPKGCVPGASKSKTKDKNAKLRKIIFPQF
jgi:hypothetical protein